MSARVPVELTIGLAPALISCVKPTCVPVVVSITATCPDGLATISELG